MRRHLALVVLLASVLCTGAAAPQRLAWQPSAGPTGAQLRAIGLLRDNSILVGTAGESLYRSADAGASWSHMGTGPLTAVLAQPGSLLLGFESGEVRRSTDGGATWSSSTAPGAVRAIVATADRGLFVGTGAGVARSTDGVGWGLTGLASPVHALAVAPGGRILFAGTDAGVLRSTDDGASWSEMGGDVGPVLALAMNGRGQVFAAGRDVLVRSVDDGVSWERVTPPGARDVAAVGTDDGALLFVLSEQDGLFRSADTAATWTRIEAFPVGMRALAVGVSGAMLATDGVRAVGSTDRGASWTPVALGWATAGIRAIVTPVGEVVIAATRGEGLFRSTDATRTWTAVAGDARLRDVRLLASTATRAVLAAPEAGGILVSRDGGTTFTAAAGVSRQVRAIAPTQGGPIYVLTEGAVARSIDDGASWKRVPGIDGASVSALAVGSSDTLLAGTAGGVLALEAGSSAWKPVTLAGEAVGALAARGGRWIALVGGELAVTMDAGVTWTRAPSPTRTLRALAVGPGGDLLLAAEASAVMRSTDGGRTWVQESEGITDTCALSLAIDPAGHLLAGTCRAGVFRTRAPLPVAAPPR